MTDAQIIQKAIEEIELKQFGTMEQFLEVHEILTVDGKPQALRVDKESSDGSAIVYFQVKDERLYLAVYLDLVPQIAVRGVGTENHNRVYLKVVSDVLNLEELSQLTGLKPSSGWSKGERRKQGNSTYNFTAVFFEPNPEPDECEDKLRKLLDFLEQDMAGVKELLARGDGCVNVATTFHNGNTMLGGYHLDKSIIKRLSALELEIDFDLYAEGHFFIS